MAKTVQKVGKSETLTIRLDPKTRFILEYVSKLKGQTITTVVERAIVSAATEEKLRDYEFGGELSWHDFWDVTDGVRALRMAERKEFYPTYEEEKRLHFCKEHWPFFWASRDRKTFLNHYVEVLWPRIDEFIQMHEDERVKDYFASGKAMRAALSDAKLRAPEWPIVEKKPVISVPPKNETSGFQKAIDDDDIPF